MTATERVVAIGGGHGLANTLRAAACYAKEVVGVVSVADDGGSSGRLRASYGIPAPGDLRRCLTALAFDGPLARAFEHRFQGGELDGHPLGNLVIAGLAAATGDFVSAIDEAGRLLGAAGRVLPASTSPVTLLADTASGPVEGQVAVSRAGRVVRVHFDPPAPPAPPEAVQLIGQADQVVLGPGSLFTSVLAAAAIPDIRRAIAATTAQRVYVCNLRPQMPETAGFDVAAHVAALAAHGVEVDIVLTDPAFLPTGTPQIETREMPLARASGLSHDPAKLASALSDLVG